MPIPKRGTITDALRQRVLHGVRSGALAPGERLPSTREVSVDLGVDPRVVAAAYRVLAAEGLVELRTRAGVFVAGAEVAADGATPAAAWAVDAMLAARAHGLAPRQAATQLKILGSGEGIRAVVAATMADQVVGLARELRDDFGLDARGVLIEPVSRMDHWPRALERAHVVVTTPMHALRLRRLHRNARPVLITGVRSDLLGPEWRLLARGVAYVLIAEPRFGAIVREFLEALGPGHDVRIRIAGRDRIDDIPPDAPTYVTEAARNILGRTKLPGRLIPPARILDEQSARQIAAFIVRRNATANG